MLINALHDACAAETACAVFHNSGSNGVFVFVCFFRFWVLILAEYFLTVDACLESMNS